MSVKRHNYKKGQINAANITRAGNKFTEFMAIVDLGTTKIELFFESILAMRKGLVKYDVKFSNTSNIYLELNTHKIADEPNLKTYLFKSEPKKIKQSIEILPIGCI